MADNSTLDAQHQITSKITAYNGKATAGNGVAVITAYGRVTGQTAAVASIAAHTVGDNDATYEVSANVLVTTATTHTFTLTCAYTDEGNSARTLTLTFGLVAGGVATTSIANATGAVPYHGVPVTIRCKAGTTVTIASAAGGTYTTVVYNAEATIKKVA